MQREIRSQCQWSDKLNVISPSPRPLIVAMTINASIVWSGFLRSFLRDSRGKNKEGGKREAAQREWHRHSRIDANQGTTRINAEQNTILRDARCELINSLLWSRQRTRCRCSAKFFLFDEESQEHVRIHTKILATCYLRFTPKREKKRGKGEKGLILSRLMSIWEPLTPTETTTFLKATDA